MYFRQFPSTLYQVADATARSPAKYVALTDIIRNVRFKREVLNRVAVYDYYTITDGQTVENLSEQLYGTPYYHWVLMLFNDRYDYINDWPLSTRQLDRLIEERYNFEVNGTPYIETAYGATPQTLIVDLINPTNGNLSTDYVGTARLIDRDMLTVTYRDIISASRYDATLKRSIKRFIYTDGLTPEDPFVDLSTFRIDFGVIPNCEPITAVELENNTNENKRSLKIVSPAIMQVIVQNFRELM